MSLVLRDIGNIDHHFGNAFRYEQNSTNHIKEEFSNASTFAIDTIDDDETIYGDDERSVASSDIEGYMGESSSAARKARPEVPAIFFGTPCQAEHERRAKYSSKMRGRRLLRRDSLDLARRKSVGSSIDKGTSPPSTQADIDAKQLERNDSDPVMQATSEANLASNSSADKSMQLQSMEDEWEPESNADGEIDELESYSGDTTVQSRSRDAQDSSSDDSHSLNKEEIPSTPINEGMIPSLSRQSLILSDTDSSPGMALAIQNSTSLHSPVSRSPLQCRDENIDHSPEALRLGDLSLCKLDNLHSTKEKLSPFIPRHINIVMTPSPEKPTRSVSPSKCPQGASTSSPVKVAVRQTLSAWAHAKLKTPQSPEKKEWERDHAHLISPSRGATIMSTNPPSRNTAPTHSNNVSSTAPISSVKVHDSSSVQRNAPDKSETIPNLLTDKQIGRPIRPLPLSRIPKPVKRPILMKVPVKPVTAARRIEVATPVTPSSVRIRDNLSSSAPRLDVSKSNERLLMSAPARSPFKHSIGPFASRQIKQIQTIPQPLTLRSLLTSSTQSSPNKMSIRQMSSRPISDQSSSPPKRMPFMASKISNEPIVRDAKLAVSRSKLNVAQASPVPSAPSLSQVEHMASSHLREILKANADLTKQPAISTAKKAHENYKGNVEPKREDKTQSVAKRASHQLANEGRDVKTPFIRSIDDPIAKDAKTYIHNINSNFNLELDNQKVKEARQGQQDRRVVKSEASRRHYENFIPISKSELSRLTSLHTRRNETFALQIDTVVIRKAGENRPTSPSSKIRRSEGSSTRRTLSQEACKKAREDRAKKRIRGGKDEETEEVKPNVPFFHNDCHFLGAGETSIFISPPRSNNAKGKTVRWQKTLFQSRQRRVPDGDSHTRSNTVKSCLSSTPFTLDRFGNVNDKKPIWSPSQKQGKVTVYKIIYDDDEQ